MNSVKNIAVDAVEKTEHLFVLYSRATRHPFVRYDKAEGKDRIYLFAEEERAEEEAQNLIRYGYLMQIADIPRQVRRLFFANLHALGVDQIVFRDTASTTTLDLMQIHPLDLSKIPVQQRPHLNPALQLTSIYFLQEMSRQVEEADLTEDDKIARADLDSEFGHYLGISKYMVPIHVKTLRGDRPGMRISQKNFDPVYVSDTEGKNWVPIFSDVTEFEKFNDEQKFQAVLFDLEQIRQLVQTGMAGAILNPRSQAYKLLPRAIALLVEHYKK